jgi:capsular polysaccharide biosynthesis protein
MKRTIQITAALVAGLMSMGSTLAAESVADAARRCAQILGERERLACFDRAFTAGPETAALAESRAAAPAAPAAVIAPAAPVRAAAPAAASVAAPVAAASVATAATVVAAPALGDDQIRKYDKQAKEASDEPKNMTAKVTALKEIREDTWRMNLDNGQVWQQMDMSSTFNPSVGDTVQVQKKMMGGYSLALGGEKKSQWIRVTRLE